MRHRVGLLGGTFNPIHCGHIDLGRQVRENFRLEKILYILSAQPPHKQEMTIATAHIRWEMLRTALQRFPYLEPCDIEMKRTTWSWTIDTVNQLKETNPDTDYYFISGSEGFLKIKTWKDYKTLLHQLSFIVVLRNPDHKLSITTLLAEENGPHVYDGVMTDEKNTSDHSHKPESAVYMFSYDSRQLAISSTLVREKIKSAQPIDALVDDEVKRIMEEYKLYER